jgi:hypothetical protein
MGLFFPTPNGIIHATKQRKHARKFGEITMVLRRPIVEVEIGDDVG